MHFEDPTRSPVVGSDLSSQSWTKALNSYHWFVLVVAALGWMFDTMDQQLFNLARKPAITELLQVPVNRSIRSRSPTTVATPR